MTTGTVWVNGHPSNGSVPVTDSSVLRGDGCFEVLRSFGGVPFGLDRHLDRLERSAARLDLPLPPREEIAGRIGLASSERPEGVVRVLVTRGSALPDADATPNVVVFAHEWDDPPTPSRLYPVVAPWHSAGAEWDLAGVKMLSYAPHMAASRAARKAGFDDALLVSREGVVLEGPTFSVAWVRGGVVRTPELGLGILSSVTRSFVIEIARSESIPLEEGVWGLEDIRDADEVFAMSTIRRVQTVSAVGDAVFGPGPITAKLADRLAQMSVLEG
jgi:branched-chain amino acid aminotransferase